MALPSLDPRAFSRRIEGLHPSSHLGREALEAGAEARAVCTPLPYSKRRARAPQVSCRRARLEHGAEPGSGRSGSVVASLVPEAIAYRRWAAQNAGDSCQIRQRRASRKLMSYRTPCNLPDPVPTYLLPASQSALTFDPSLRTARQFASLEVAELCSPGDQHVAPGVLGAGASPAGARGALQEVGSLAGVAS